VETTNRDVIGLPLGIIEGSTFASCQLELEPGDCILMFSDGVTEAMDKQNHQLDLGAINTAVREGLHSPKALGERIAKIVKQHASGRSQHDDITIVCFGRDASQTPA